MQKLIQQVSHMSYDHGLGLMVARVVAGLIFFVHGWEKWQNISGTAHFFGMLGFAPQVAYFIAALELVGGLALMLGVWGRFFGLLFGIEMLIAAARVGAGKGFHGFEFELLLAAVSFAIALAGSGKFAFHNMKFR